MVVCCKRVKMTMREVKLALVRVKDDSKRGGLGRLKQSAHTSTKMLTIVVKKIFFNPKKIGGRQQVEQHAPLC